MTNKISIVVIAGIACLAMFFLGKCNSETKVVYKEKIKDSIRFEVGYLGTKIDTVKVPEYRAKFYPVHDTIRIKDSSGHETIKVQDNSYAEMDTNLTSNVLVVQKDTANNIDTNSRVNLNVELNVKYRFSDTSFSAVITPKLDQIPFVTKTTIKYTEIPYHWTRSDYFLYPLFTVATITSYYFGTKNAN